MKKLGPRKKCSAKTNANNFQLMRTIISKYVLKTGGTITDGPYLIRICTVQRLWGGFFWEKKNKNKNRKIRPTRFFFPGGGGFILSLLISVCGEKRGGSRIKERKKKVRLRVVMYVCALSTHMYVHIIIFRFVLY